MRMMSTCFWSTFESTTWNPLPTVTNNTVVVPVDQQSNHVLVPEINPGRKITSSGSNNVRDYAGRHKQNTNGRYHSYNQRSHQEKPLEHTFFRPTGFDVSKTNQPSISIMRQNSGNFNQGDGRRDDRLAKGIIGDMGRLSFKKAEWVSLVDACVEQLKMMEKFRLEKELQLATCYPDKKVTSNNSIPIARHGNELNCVDRLVTDNLKEHAKVTTMVSTMDLYHEVHPGVYSDLQSWLDSVRKLQTVRRQEVLDLQEAGDRPDLVSGGPMLLALEKLCRKTRAARTAFWSAYINFITNEWKESVNKNEPEPALKPAPPLPSSHTLVTKTGRPLIPFSLPGLP